MQGTGENEEFQGQYVDREKPCECFAKLECCYCEYGKEKS